MNFIAETIRGQICGGDCDANRRIKSERDFARDIGCSRSTVHRALETLVQEGLLEKRPCSGYFLRRRAIRSREWLRILLLRNSCKPVISGYPGRLSAYLVQFAPKYKIELTFQNAVNEELDPLLCNLCRTRDFDGILFQPDVDLRWGKGFASVLKHHYPMLFLDLSFLSHVFPVVSINLFELGFRAAEILHSRYRKARIGIRSLNRTYSRNSGDPAGSNNVFHLTFAFYL